MFHHQVYVAHYDKVVTFTGSSLLKHKKHCEDVMEQLVSTLRLRKR